MSHGFELAPAKGPELPAHPRLAAVARIVHGLHHWLLRLSMLAMLATALILTYSVVVRYFYQQPTDWQDEASVFMLIGVTFFSTGYVQAYRGHVGIELLGSLLPPRADAVRRFLVDLASFLFCAFFSWKSWAMFYEAFHEGQTTSSTLAPPLAIPYGMMAFGMTLLTLQLLLQVLARVAPPHKEAA